MKAVAKKAADIRAKIGTDGEKMGFDEFKVIETTIVKLEEKMLPGMREGQRTARRALLKEDDASTEYWHLLKQ